MADRCQVETRDYRDLPTACFDKIASVGMAEHVGTVRLGDYFRTVYRALKPGGLFLNHAIADTTGPNHVGGVLAGKGHESFIARHVFPDGELQSIHTTLAAAEGVGFEVADVESLRRHYALTLRQWLTRLEGRRDEALSLVDDVTYRVWQLYIAGSAYNFAHAHLTIFQSLLARPEADGSIPLPLTRADLYRPGSNARPTADATHDI